MSPRLFARTFAAVAGFALLAFAFANDKEPPKADAPQRKAWTTSKVTGSPDAPPKFKSVRAFPEAKFVETNGIRMAVHEQGTGFPVVFCHGFPELGYSWRHQLPALAKAGFRAIQVVDRRYLCDLSV